MYICNTLSVLDSCFQANAIGRSAKTVREFLEKNYKEEEMESDQQAVKLAVRALLEVQTELTPYNLQGPYCVKSF